MLKCSKCTQVVRVVVFLVSVNWSCLGGRVPERSWQLRTCQIQVTSSKGGFSRLQALGFPDDFKKAFKDSGLSNLGSFAFAVAPPGQAATDDKVNEFVA